MKKILAIAVGAIILTAFIMMFGLMLFPAKEKLEEEVLLPVESPVLDSKVTL